MNDYDVILFPSIGHQSCSQQLAVALGAEVISEIKKVKSDVLFIILTFNYIPSLEVKLFQYISPSIFQIQLPFYFASYH